MNEANVDLFSTSESRKSYDCAQLEKANQLL